MSFGNHTIRDPDELVPAKAAKATRRAYAKARRSGSSVMEIREGQLVETLPDGNINVLKKAAPRVKVETGVKVRLR